MIRTDLLPAVRDVIGQNLVGEFTASRAHTPRQTVLDAAQQAREIGADGLISFGGSSVVDMTKGVALVLAEGDDFDRTHASFTPETGLQLPELPAPKLPHIALPTTLSGAEFTGAIGITDEARGEKELFVDAKLTPRWVFLDPELSTATPNDLWAGTGMKLFADGLESICSLRTTPYTDALAQQGLNLLFNHLPASVVSSDRVADRGRCLFAAFMLLPNLLNVGLGMVAGLRHQIGASSGVPHGVASTIVLPHVLRWNLPAATEQLAQTALRLDIAKAGTEPELAARQLIEAVERLIAQLNLPSRLRDVDVSEAALTGIAEHVLHDFVLATNPRRVDNREEVVDILRAAW